MEALAWHEIYRSFAQFVPRVGLALAILVGFWQFAIIARRIVRKATVLRRINDDVIEVLSRAVSLTVLAFGLVTAMGTIGVDIGAMVAGLGLTGFALGFALKEVISNALAGMLILTYQPFRRNDRILVTGLEGIVTQIDLRYTTLQTSDRRILIPNSSLLTNPITVVTEAPRAAEPV